MDHISPSGNGLSLIWIDAILLVPAIFGVMFLGWFWFAFTAVVMGTIMSWMFLKRRRPS